MGKKIVFLCDGKVHECNENKGCFNNGGSCEYTTNIEHAKNFKKLDGNPTWYVEIKPEDKR